MKKLLSTILTASVIASSIGTAPATYTKAATSDPVTEDTASVTDLSKYENNDIIVVYKKDANATEKKTFSICSLSDEEEEKASVDTLTDNSVVLSLDSKDALEDAVEALSNDSRVDYIQPNYVYHLTDTDVSTTLKNLQENQYFSNQWGLYNDGTLSYEEEDYRTGSSNDWFIPWNLHTDAESRFPSIPQYDTFTVNAVNRMDIQLPEAWSACNSSKREVVVAFVDTGVKYDHSELKDSMWVNEDEIPDDGIDNDNNGYIDDIYGWNFYESSSFLFGSGKNNNSSSSGNGNNQYYNANSTEEDAHGTHGAGSVVAANNDSGTVGVAANSNVKIMTVKALGGTYGYGSTSSLVKGIEYAEANGADICNLSLGGEEDDPTLHSVIENSKMLFTVAAGNGDESTNAVNNDTTPTYPACYDSDNIISVANLQCDGTLHYSSNYGATSVDIAAPGSYVYSTSTSTSGYDCMTGTSMAAPIVSGIAAMLYSCYDNLTLTDVKNIIMQTATKLDSLDGKCVSGGMLNAYAAVSYAESGKIPATSVPTATPKVTPTTEPTATPTKKPTSTPTKKPTATPTNAPGETVTSTPKPTNTSSPDSTPDVTPTQVPGATQTDSPAPGTTLEPTKDIDFLSIDTLSISGGSTRYVGQTYTVKASASGATGNYQYRFTITKNGATKAFQAYSTKNSMSFKPTSSGSYIIRVSVKDANGDYAIKYQTITITKLSITKVTTSKSLKKGITVKLKATLNAGKSPFTYKFYIYRSGKKIQGKTTKNNYINWKITQKGTYKIKIQVKDSLGNTASKTVNCKVKK